MKQKVIEIVQAALANSENELYELKKEFMKAGLDMGSEYCDPGLYKAECKELWKCLEWVKNAKRKKRR